jgi:hypothetical protein
LESVKARVEIMRPLTMSLEGASSAGDRRPSPNIDRRPFPDRNWRQKPKEIRPALVLAAIADEWLPDLRPQGHASQGNRPGEFILFAVRPADNSCGNCSRLPLQFGGDQRPVGRIDFAKFECWPSRGLAGAPMLTPHGEARSPIFAPARSQSHEFSLDLTF